MLPLGLVLASVAVSVHAPQAAMELSFSRVAVKPGESAALPIYLVSSQAYPQPFQITLDFAAGELTFQKIEIAYLAARAKWTIRGAVRAHPEKSDRRILQIDITPVASTFFPSGAVAHAHFLVDKKQANGEILLQAALRAPAAAPPVRSPEPAKITVFTTPIFGCFFYMH